MNSLVLTLSQFFLHVYILCAEQICLNAEIVFEISSIKLRCSSGIEGNPVVFYRLMPGSTAQTNKFHTFYLQQRPDNGDTWADIKVNHPLDYESIKEYNLTIRVEVSTKNHNFYDFIFVLILIPLKWFRIQNFISKNFQNLAAKFFLKKNKRLGIIASNVMDLAFGIV